MWHDWKYTGPAALMIVGLCGGVRAQTSATYHVTVQAPATASAKPSGLLIFEFNGGVGALSATASISGLVFSGDYVLDGYTTFGSATAPVGTQGRTGTISNGASNANGFYTDAAPFGTLMSFDVTFTGAALKPTGPLPTAGSDFFLTLSDGTDADNPIWTTDPQNRALDIPINANGTFGTSPYSLSSVATVVATPEPTSSAALGAGAFLLLGLGVRARRRSD